MNSTPRLFRYILLGSILYFTIQCQSKKNESSTIKENTCHCNDLVYDELYNYFFIEKRELVHIMANAWNIMILVKLA